MKRSLSLIIISLLPFSSIFARYTANLLIDPDMSPYAGATNIITIEQGVLLVGDQVWKVAKGPTSHFKSIANRAAKMLLLMDPANIFLMTTQHEIFGHGARIRSLGSDKAKVLSYSVNAPVPYGNAGGSTSYKITDQFTISDELAVDLAGVSATAILANEVRTLWVEEGIVNPYQATLYLFSFHDLTEYIRQLDVTSASNDLGNFVLWLNMLYPGDALTEDRLKTKSRWSLLDPFTFYALFSYVDFIFTGSVHSVPMLKLGSIKYLPTCRLALTPFGTERRLENFIKWKEKVLTFYLRYGKNAATNYKGLGLRFTELFRYSKGSLGFEFDFWDQPGFSSTEMIPLLSMDDQAREQYPSTEGLPIIDDAPSSNDMGGFCSLIGRYYFDAKKHTSIYGIVGYKTSGYLEGLDLDSAAIIRLGLSASF